MTPSFSCLYIFFLFSPLSFQVYPDDAGDVQSSAGELNCVCVCACILWCKFFKLLKLKQVKQIRHKVDTKGVGTSGVVHPI